MRRDPPLFKGGTGLKGDLRSLTGNIVHRKPSRKPEMEGIQ